MPRLHAEFEVVEGAPRFFKGDKHDHYSIKLSVPDAPQDAITIIYLLDSSYKNPVRMVTRGVPEFQEYITSYGDYEVRVLYRSASEPNNLVHLIAIQLSDALRENYGKEVNSQIQAAIDAISSH